MPSKLIYEIVENDNNIEAQLNCSDEITEVLNSSECIQKDILTKTLHNNGNNKNQIKHKTNQSLKNEEGIRSFFISNQLWIVTLLILIIVIVIALLSVWFGIVNLISSTTNETINKICLEPIESGPCRASIEMFAFNVDQWRCIKFIYGGCHGNSNQFASIEECEAVCH
ncbi:unnamed protein product [Schistosoma intercalatum]|nr:unnamed protein product [Schistosoma intercalatum]CAH8508778.1 unnamed protein product [Schistosoma intercalatum]